MVKPKQTFKTNDHKLHGLRNMFGLVMFIDSAFAARQK